MRDATDGVFVFGFFASRGWQAVKMEQGQGVRKWGSKVAEEGMGEGRGR